MKTRLQEIRKERGWKSARAFAEHIGMPVSTYTNYEQGKRMLMFDTAITLCNALNCTLDELAGRSVMKVGDEVLIQMLTDRLNDSKK